jgi:hypothetical protein
MNETQAAATASPRGSEDVRVRVAEISAERHVDDPPEIPWHIMPGAGDIAVQLRTTVRRVVVGAGLARNAELLERVRQIDGIPAVVTSPVGGTFIIGGDAWLGLCAIGVPLPGQPLPLDWVLRSLHGWLDAALATLGVTIEVGRVEGAWCPGFSDIAAQGRKIAGLGFRVTRDWVVMRGVMAVQPMNEADLEVLVQCHRLINVEVRGDTATSVSEAAELPRLDVDAAINAIRDVET